MDKKDRELNVLFLEYQRQISIAHTIFGTFFDTSLAILFGTFGIVIGLVEIEVMPWNKFYFLLAISITVAVNGIVLMLSLLRWYFSRLERENIKNKILDTGI